MKRLLILSAMTAMAIPSMGVDILNLKLDQNINIGLGDAIDMSIAGLDSTMTFMPDDGGGGFIRHLTAGGSWYYGPRIWLSRTNIGSIDITDPSTVMYVDIRLTQTPLNTNQWGDSNEFLRMYDYNGAGALQGYRDFTMIVGPNWKNNSNKGLWQRVKVYLSDPTIHKYTDIASASVFNPAHVTTIRFHGSNWNGAGAGDTADFRNMVITKEVWETILDTQGFEGYTLGSLNGQNGWVGRTAGFGFDPVIVNNGGNKAIKLETDDINGDASIAELAFDDLKAAGYSKVRVSFDTWIAKDTFTDKWQNLWWYWFDTGTPTYGLAWDAGQWMPFGFDADAPTRGIDNGDPNTNPPRPSEYGRYVRQVQEWDFDAGVATAWVGGNKAGPTAMKITDINSMTGWGFSLQHDAADFTAYGLSYIDNFKIEGIKGGLKVDLDITLGDWTGASKPVDIELREPGTSTVVYSTTVTPAGDGTASFEANIPAGNYDVSAKASHWLRKTLGNVALPGGVVDISLTNGDVDGDNVITVFDYNALSDAFDTAPGDGGWNAEADLDGDEAVTVFDYNILSNNFDMVGDD